ncbi:hypothetical protein FGB62_143g03 [Gracilaria domingensis]|nr:hypothetical protein FGB62_143g03 [Gracilaria domingensis]
MSYFSTVVDPTSQQEHLTLRVHRLFPPLRPGDPLPREASELPVGVRFTLEIDNDLHPYLFLDPEGQEQWLSRPGPNDAPSDIHGQDRPPEENEELPEIVMDDSDDANSIVQIVAPADDDQFDWDSPDESRQIENFVCVLDDPASPQSKEDEVEQ